MMRRHFEPCGRDRHHYPHVTQLRPVEEIPYEPDEGFNIEQFEEIVCPGSGSDAMDPHREAVKWIEQIALDAMDEASARHSPPEVAESIWSKTQEAIETLRSAASTGNA